MRFLVRLNFVSTSILLLLLSFDLVGCSKANFSLDISGANSKTNSTDNNVGGPNLNPPPTPDPLNCTGGRPAGDFIEAVREKIFNIAYVRVPNCESLGSEAQASCRAIIGAAVDQEIHSFGEIRLNPNQCGIEASGTSACNNWSSQVSVQSFFAGHPNGAASFIGANVKFGPIAATRMGCDERRTHLENILADTLSAVVSMEYKVEYSTEYLWLKTADGRVIKSAVK